MFLKFRNIGSLSLHALHSKLRDWGIFSPYSGVSTLMTLISEINYADRESCILVCFPVIVSHQHPTFPRDLEMQKLRFSKANCMRFNTINSNVPLIIISHGLRHSSFEISFTFIKTLVLKKFATFLTRFDDSMIRRFDPIEQASI